MIVEKDDDRQVASRLAARCQLRDLRAVSAQMDLTGQRDPLKQLTFALSQDVTVECDTDQGRPDVLVVEGSYTVTLSLRADKAGSADGGTEVQEDEPLSSISFSLQSLYTIEWRNGDEAVSQEELEAFARTTGAFALYPFAREWAHDLTGRMGLPPLTLPLFSVATSGPGAADG